MALQVEPSINNGICQKHAWACHKELHLLQEQPVHPEAPDFQQARRSLAAVKSPPEDLQFGPLAVMAGKLLDKACSVECWLVICQREFHHVAGDGVLAQHDVLATGQGGSEAFASLGPKGRHL